MYHSGEPQMIQTLPPPQRAVVSAQPRGRRSSRGMAVVSPQLPSDLVPYQQHYQQALQSFAPVYHQLKQQATDSSQQMQQYLKQNSMVERQAVEQALANYKAKVEQLKAQPEFVEQRRLHRQGINQLEDIMDQAQKEMRRFKDEVRDNMQLTEEQKEALLRDVQMQFASVVLPPQLQEVLQTLMSVTDGCDGGGDNDEESSQQPPQQQQLQYSGGGE